MLDGLEAVLFDCYGTLIDFTDEGFIAVMEEVCRGQGLPVEGRELWERFLAAAGALPGETVAGLASDNDLYYWQRPFEPYSQRWPRHFQEAFGALGVPGDPEAASRLLRQRIGEAGTYPEVGAALAALAPRYRLAVLSNADDDFLAASLAHNGLRFATLVSSERARAYKPAPAIFQRAVELLALPPSRILYAGDSPRTDIRGAKEVGLRACWVNRGRLALPEGVPPPDLEVDDLAHLATTLAGRRGGP